MKHYLYRASKIGFPSAKPASGKPTPRESQLMEIHSMKSDIRTMKVSLEELKNKVLEITALFNNGPAYQEKDNFMSLIENVRPPASSFNSITFDDDDTAYQFQEDLLKGGGGSNKRMKTDDASSSFKPLSGSARPPSDSISQWKSIGALVGADDMGIRESISLAPYSDL